MLKSYINGTGGIELEISVSTSSMSTACGANNQLDFVMGLHLDICYGFSVP